MSDNTSRSTNRRFGGASSFRTISIAFVLIGLAGAFRLIAHGFNEQTQAILATSDPWVSAIVLGISVPVLTVAAVFMSQLDRRCAEDYAYQMMANAGLVAIITTLLVQLLWDMSPLASALGIRTPSSEDIISVIMVSWALSFWMFRIRGIAA